MIVILIGMLVSRLFFTCERGGVLATGETKCGTVRDIRRGSALSSEIGQVGRGWVHGLMVSVYLGQAGY